MLLLLHKFVDTFRGQAGSSWYMLPTSLTPGQHLVRFLERIEAPEKLKRYYWGRVALLTKQSADGTRPRRVNLTESEQQREYAALARENRDIRGILVP